MGPKYNKAKVAEKSPKYTSIQKLDDMFLCPLTFRLTLWHLTILPEVEALDDYYL